MLNCQKSPPHVSGFSIRPVSLLQCLPTLTLLTLASTTKTSCYFHNLKNNIHFVQLFPTVCKYTNSAYLSLYAASSQKRITEAKCLSLKPSSVKSHTRLYQRHVCCSNLCTGVPRSQRLMKNTPKASLSKRLNV